MLHLYLLRLLSRSLPALTLGCGLLLLSGCAGMLRPRNYMCQAGCHAHAQETIGQPTVAAVDGSLAALANESMVQVHERLEEIAADHALLREELSALDKRNEQQRTEQKELLNVMQKVAGGIANVHEELDRQQHEFVVAQTRLTNDREQNDRVLADVERQLNELLSKYENAAPSP